ncbi:GNAT family acetyltransferase [Parasphingorhabdus sp.]|uniref:GNAT family acetyltransferase n=1 Tax=Parasphingorhabdus sp. TaxID=2709688 RepID=UPI002F9351A9
MIRFATQADCGAVVAIWQVCGLTRPWNDATADFRRAVGGTASEILCFEQEGKLSGTVMVGDDGHRGWVYYLGILPESRRQGLGRMMMEAAEKWLRERDAPKIQLMVRDDNRQAIEFYEAIGYEVQPVITIGKRLD